MRLRLKAAEKRFKVANLKKTLFIEIGVRHKYRIFQPKTNK